MQLCQTSLNPSAYQSDISWKYGLASIIYPLCLLRKPILVAKTGCRVAELTWLVCIGNTIVVSWSLQRLSLLANLVMVSDSLVARCFPDSCCSEDFIMALKMVKGWLKLLFKIRVILWELDVTRQTCLTQWLCENSWTSWSLKLPQDSLHPWLQIAHGPILSISPC